MTSRSEKFLVHITQDAATHVAALELQQEMEPTDARHEMLAFLRHRLRSLDTLPRIGPPWIVPGLHHLTVLTHTVVYRVVGSTVEVLGVVDSRAHDVLRQLAQQWQPQRSKP